MITLENDLLRAAVHPKGAELQSLVHKQHATEYIWKGDPAYWGKHSPVLFPIVGALKDDVYEYDHRRYSLPRHGFARNHVFSIERQEHAQAIFQLRSSRETRAVFPFSFVLNIYYTLQEASLSVRYEVINTGDALLYFSIGGHPAFNVPLEPALHYEDYALVFEQPETLDRWPLQNGLISAEGVPFLNNETEIPLSKPLFYEDAIVLKHPRSASVVLKSMHGKRGLNFHFGGFSYLGIWAAKDAPFVCIEPWSGIADSIHHNQKLIEKEGILRLEANETWERSWSVDCF